MSSVVFEKKDIYSLIEHHIALLKRFGLVDEEPFSLVYFSLKNNPKIDYAKIFQEILRKTDALFQDKTDFVALLPGTDWNGANSLLEGIQGFLGQESSDDIVTFPEDGKNAKEIMASLYKIILYNLDVEVEMLKF